MVLTSHDQLGNTGRKTGFWLEELAAPYYVFKDAGAQITLASPKGDRPPSTGRNSGGGGRNSGPGGGRGRERFSNEDYRESARQPREPRW